MYGPEWKAAPGRKGIKITLGQVKPGFAGPGSFRGNKECAKYLR